MNRAITICLSAAAIGGLSLFAGAQSAHESPSPVSANPALEDMDVRKVDRQAVEQDFTARDLIGRSVVGRDGRTIGDIMDLGFSQDFVLAEKLDEVPVPEQVTTTDEYGRELTAASGEIGRSQNEEPVVYLSVGGVIGVGAEILSVPAAALEWDAAEGTFRLDVTRENLLAMADDAGAGPIRAR